ncbi:hypothetical protein AURDEDRAFT_129576 [Auricularia subglabra TFB-10046 SS5]|nr:hypothetical protein AURDEDRAFT_129576 [Auricularia subglabra TFB-10046 SS5]
MGEKAARLGNAAASDIETPHGPFSRPPVEILCYLARFCAYSDVCAAVNVCRRWRGTLLVDRSLWTHVRVWLPSSSHGRWLSTIRTLVGRSAGRLLVLELATEDRVQERYSRKYIALERVAHFLAGHMSVIEMLNLSIPTCVTPFWSYCLQQKAPLLRSFCLYNMTYFDSEPHLPPRLFDGHANRLETMCLEQAFLRDDLVGSPALQNVTSLYYHNCHNSLDKRDMLDYLDEFMPRLTRLTCTVLESYGREEFTYHRPIDLRLVVAPQVAAMAARFPRATSVVYSYFYQNIRKNPLPSIVESAIRAQGPATSVDIAWAPGPRDMPYWFCTNEPEEQYTIAVNGRPLIVDIHIDALRAELSRTTVALIAARVQRLAIVDALWPVFASVEMPALEELTLYLRARDDWSAPGSIFHQPPVGRRRALRALRIARATRASQNASDFAIPATLIATFVRTTITSGCLPTLHLNGVRAIGDGTADLATITARTVHGQHSLVEEPEPWSWELRVEDALTC